MQEFNFRIINTPDGNQIIDRQLKTPYNALTPLQMIEYIEMDNRLDYIDRMERRDRQKEEHNRRLLKNPLYRIACICGIF